MLGWSLNENLGAGSEVTVRQLPDFWPLGNPTLSTFVSCNSLSMGGIYLT